MTDSEYMMIICIDFRNLKHYEICMKNVSAFEFLLFCCCIFQLFLRFLAFSASPPTFRCIFQVFRKRVRCGGLHSLWSAPSPLDAKLIPNSKISKLIDNDVVCECPLKHHIEVCSVDCFPWDSFPIHRSAVSVTYLPRAKTGYFFCTVPPFLSATSGWSHSPIKNHINTFITSFTV